MAKSEQKPRSEFDLDFFEISVCKNKKIQPYFNVFNGQGANFDEQKLGELFGVIQVFDYSKNSAYLPNVLAQVIKKEFFKNPKRSTEECFEACLHKANLALRDLAQHEIIEWMGKFNAIIGVMEGNNFYFTQAGGGRILLIRNKLIADISRGLDEGEGIGHPVKTFSNTSCGILQDKDKVIFTTETVFDTVSWEDLKRYTTAFDSAEFDNIFSSTLEVEGDQAGAIVINVQEKAIAPATIKNPASTEPINFFGNNDHTTKISKPVPVGQDQNKKISQYVTNVLSKTTQLSGVVQEDTLANIENENLFPPLLKSAQLDGKNSQSVNATFNVKNSTNNTNESLAKKNVDLGDKCSIFNKHANFSQPETNSPISNKKTITKKSEIVTEIPTPNFIKTNLSPRAEVQNQSFSSNSKQRKTELLDNLAEQKVSQIVDQIVEEVSPFDRDPELFIKDGEEILPKQAKEKSVWKKFKSQSNVTIHKLKKSFITRTNFLGNTIKNTTATIGQSTAEAIKKTSESIGNASHSIYTKIEKDKQLNKPNEFIPETEVSIDAELANELKIPIDQMETGDTQLEPSIVAKPIMKMQEIRSAEQVISKSMLSRIRQSLRILAPNSALDEPSNTRPNVSIDPIEEDTNKIKYESAIPAPFVSIETKEEHIVPNEELISENMLIPEITAPEHPIDLLKNKPALPEIEMPIQETQLLEEPETSTELLESFDKQPLIGTQTITQKQDKSFAETIISDDENSTLEQPEEKLLHKLEGTIEEGLNELEQTIKKQKKNVKTPDIIYLPASIENAKIILLPAASIPLMTMPDNPISLNEIKDKQETLIEDLSKQSAELPNFSNKKINSETTSEENSDNSEIEKNIEPMSSIEKLKQVAIDEISNQKITERMNQPACQPQQPEADQFENIQANKSQSQSTEKTGSIISLLEKKLSLIIQFKDNLPNIDYSDFQAKLNNALVGTKSKLLRLKQALKAKFLDIKLSASIFYFKCKTYINKTATKNKTIKKSINISLSNSIKASNKINSIKKINFNLPINKSVIKEHRNLLIAISLVILAFIVITWLLMPKKENSNNYPTNNENQSPSQTEPTTENFQENQLNLENLTKLDGNIIKIVGLKEDLFLLTDDDRVFDFDPKNNNLKELTLPKELKKIKTITPMPQLQLVFIISDNQVFSYSPVTGKYDANRLNLPTDFQPITADTYLTYLYLFDKTSGQIYQYPRAFGGFEQPKLWLRDTIDQANVTCAYVNGFIHIGFNDGTIRRYSKGKLDENFNFNKDNTDFIPSKIQSENEGEKIYVLASKNGSLLELDSKGNILKEQMDSRLLNAKDFWFDNKENLLYLVDEKNQLFKLKY